MCVVLCCPSQVLTLPNEGMPVHGVPSEFGNLYVHIKIVMPTTLNDAEMDFVRTHFEPTAEERPGGDFVGNRPLDAKLG